MKSYYDYSPQEGLPASAVVIREGLVTCVFFDHHKIERTIDDETVEMVECENVDINGTGYADIVNGIVTDRYPDDKFQAVMANYADATSEDSTLSDEKKAEYISEYNDFQAWRKRAKEVANEVVEQING